VKSSVIALALFLIVSANISMYNLKIGDAQSTLEKIDLEVVARDADMVKFKTKDGNDFSVTSENGKIVYMENDWLQDPNAAKPLYSNFEFGKTSLADIRKAFGNNGYTYQSRGPFVAGNDVILFNSFEFESPNNEVLTVVTKVAIGDDVTEENIAARAKLDAIIIADSKYLESTWGAEKLFDPAYKKIKP
jgi:hypothetical protein